VQILTRNEFLELLGLSGGALDQLQHTGHVALAFGTPLPATPGRYLDIDLVAMAINLGLSQSLGRNIATTIVASFFHQWAAVVGYAEADPSRDYYMAVGRVGSDEAKKAPKLLIVTNGRLDEITKDFRDEKDLVGFFGINVSDIIRRLRAKAQAVGIGLSGAFFFPPDDPRFNQLLTQVQRERDARIARLRRDRKKYAAVKQQQRQRESIYEPQRFREFEYPPAVREIFAATSTTPLSAGGI
jgi:hypothetical protein